MNRNPRDVDGANPGESSDQLMARYMEHMWPNLLKELVIQYFLGEHIENDGYSWNRGSGNLGPSSTDEIQESTSICRDSYSS